MGNGNRIEICRPFILIDNFNNLLVFGEVCFPRFKECRVSLGISGTSSKWVPSELFMIYNQFCTQFVLFNDFLGYVKVLPNTIRRFLTFYWELYTKNIFRIYCFVHQHFGLIVCRPISFKSIKTISGKQFFDAARHRLITCSICGCI